MEPSRRPRQAKPLDPARLDELALAYVARFATSAAKLAAYLRRKLRERGWEGSAEPEVARIVQRMVDHHYIDDAGFARSRAEGLRRRGYGARRIDQALLGAGIGEDDRAAARGDAAAARNAALVLARKRGFGPFGLETPDRARREKQIAAMLRAGHPLDSARQLVDAASQAAALEWVEAAAEESA